MKNITLKIMVGASGSGKSFAAKQLLAKEKSWKCLERDKIRSMLAAENNIWRQGDKIESLVTKTQEFLAEQLINEGFNVLISDTCLNAKTREFWRQFAARMSVKFELDDSFLSVPLSVMLERDMHRENSVGAEVIIKQYEKYVKPLNSVERPYTDFLPNKLVQDELLPKAILFDVDGTTSISQNYDKTQPNFRNPYDHAKAGNDSLNEIVKIGIDLFYQAGYIVLGVSGREEKYREVTENWFAKHDVKYHEFHMRKTGDSSKDSIIKAEIYRELAKRFNLVLSLDDRKNVVDMARLELGLNVWQVNAGNF